MINDEVMQSIWNSVDESDKWVARKFIANMDEHKRRHPAFKEERVAAIFIEAELKYKKAYAYQPISKFTKSIHKLASLRSQAAGQA